MVFARADFSWVMKRAVGYWFALPRLLARCGDGEVRRVQWSRWEAYGLGWLVFGFGCVSLGRALFVFVRPGPWRLLILFAIPFGVWIGCLIFYFVSWLFALLLRRLGLYSARTNNPLQSFMIIALVTLMALSLARGENGWLRSLGIFWFALMISNLLAAIVLKLAGNRA